MARMRKKVEMHFGPKEPPCVCLALTVSERRSLEQAHRRTGQSRSNVIEQLLRAHAVALAPEGGAHAGTRPQTNVTLTALAKRLLAATAARLGQTSSHVAGQLLRAHAAGLVFVAAPPDPAASVEATV